MFNIFPYLDIIRRIKELTHGIQTHSEGCVAPVYSEPRFIQNPGILTTVAYLEPKEYLVLLYNHGLKHIGLKYLQLRVLRKKCKFYFEIFSNRPQFGRVCIQRSRIFRNYPGIFSHIKKPVSSWYIQSPGIFRTLAYSGSWYIQSRSIFRTLLCSESWYIQNLGIFRTIACSEPWHIKNPDI